MFLKDYTRASNPIIHLERYQSNIINGWFCAYFQGQEGDSDSTKNTGKIFKKVSTSGFFLETVHLCVVPKKQKEFDMPFGAYLQETKHWSRLGVTGDFDIDMVPASWKSQSHSMLYTYAC